MKERRSEFLIIRDILKAAYRPVVKREIISSSNLQHKKANEFIDKLMRVGCLKRLGTAPKKRGVYYASTEKGTRLFTKIQEIEAMLSETEIPVASGN